LFSVAVIYILSLSVLSNVNQTNHVFSKEQMVAAVKKDKADVALKKFSGRLTTHVLLTEKVSPPNILFGKLIDSGTFRTREVAGATKKMACEKEIIQ
jgi:hypothetical protein